MEKIDGGAKCSFCDFKVADPSYQKASAAVRRHERQNHPAEARKPPPGGGVDDASELTVRLGQVLADHAPDIRESSHRALLMDFDQQLNNIHTREQLALWLEHDYHDVLNPGQVRRISRAMFPAASASESEAGSVPGVRVVNVPGMGPVLVLGSTQTAQSPAGPQILQLGGQRDEVHPAVQARLSTVEESLKEIKGLLTERRNTGPPTRRRMVPQRDEAGELVRDPQTGEPSYEVMEEPYDPQDATFERFATFQQRFMSMMPKPQASDGLRAEDIRQAAREATEPLHKELQEVKTQLNMDRVRVEVEESVRAREVKPLRDELTRLTSQLDEVRRNQGMSPDELARQTRQERLLTRADKLFETASEYVNLQNLRQMGVSPDRLADVYNAKRSKGQVSEDEWAAMAAKVRR